MSRFEEAIQKTQQDIETAITAAKATLTSLKRAGKSVTTGDIRQLSRQIEATEAALAKLSDCVRKVEEGWEFDADSYFSDGDFIDDVMAEAGKRGVSIHEMDGRLFCYPCILKPLSSEYAVMIDKKREKRVRPSYLAELLHALQNKPVKFRPEAFLESLYSGYQILVEQKHGKKHMPGHEIPLVDIYKLLILLPGQNREYSRQEFARDIYLLDKSHIIVTKDNSRISFQGSTGTRSPSRCLRIITREGAEQIYFSISFVKND